jgi:hypothetical protein
MHSDDPLPNILPLDLIFFNGSEFVSKAIRCIQRRQMRYTGKRTPTSPECKVWSHVGLVVTRELYDDPRLEPGRLYVLESTMSGSLGDGVPNIDGGGFLGVQIRDLRALVRHYTDPDEPRLEIGWARLRDNPFARARAIERFRCHILFTSWCKLRWEGTPYDVNLISLGGAAFQHLRPVRALVARFARTGGWQFCSELVFRVLQVLGVYSEHYDPRNVVPMDLLGWDADDPPIPQRFDPVLIL